MDEWVNGNAYAIFLCDLALVPFSQSVKCDYINVVYLQLSICSWMTINWVLPLCTILYFIFSVQFTNIRVNVN